jgi:dipeptidyl-peptidase-4
MFTLNINKNAASYTAALLAVTILTACSTKILSNMGVEKKAVPQKQNDPRAGVISDIKWAEDGKSLEFANSGMRYSFSIDELKTSELGKAAPKKKRKRPEKSKVVKTTLPKEHVARKPRTVEKAGRDIARPTRGRQWMTEVSHDENWFAVSKDWNVWLENDKTGERIQVTSEGNMKFRFGTANWVYGEEISVRHGMWFSADDRYLAYYVFDERPVKDFYLLGKNSSKVTTMVPEGYSKAGDPNPIVTLEIYDRKTKTKKRLDVGEQKRDQYLYNVKLTKGTGELLFNTKDRSHHQVDVRAINFATGKIRNVVSERQDSWQDSSPRMTFLSDEQRFIWPTEKTLWKNYELRNLNGHKITTLTKGDTEVIKIVKVDEKGNQLFYTAYSDTHPLNAQLHSVGLDGKNQQRLTPLSMHYSKANISPDNKYFTAQYESIDTTPTTALYSISGKLIAVLAKGKKVENNLTELLTFKAQDGVTDLFGYLHFPADFDASKKYPLILATYGAPNTKAIYNRYRNGHWDTKKGPYLIIQVDGRGTDGRGKAFKAAAWRKLGDVEIGDSANGVKHVMKRPYVAEGKVGIHGHSYGGFMAAIAITKYSDVFDVAVNGAGPTDWEYYDSIYTESLLDTPQLNPEGYKNSRVMNYVHNLVGKPNKKLLIMHGLMDDNVHPTNAFKLIEELDHWGIPYESRFFPKGTHGFPGNSTKWAFFKKHFIDSDNDKKNK